MLSCERPDHIHVAFDDQRLVADAGLLLAVTLAQRQGRRRRRGGLRKMTTKLKGSFGCPHDENSQAMRVR